VNAATPVPAFPMEDSSASVELLWIPLGAGQHVVKFSGRIFEALSALIQRRSPCDIYHAALVVRMPEGRYVIEMTPIPDGFGARRGVVAEGPVGLKVLYRFRMFRYEIHCWCNGVIPDESEAVHPTTLITKDHALAQRLLSSVEAVPTPVWGRDELHAGDMWNSNSVISWLLASAGLAVNEIQPPARGRAPGWTSGVVVANRQQKLAA
jgi:hypothetical protein